MLISESTIAAYLVRGKQLWKRASEASGVSVEELLPMDYLIWLEYLLPTLKPSSRRQYIASVREWLIYLQGIKGLRGGTQNDLENAITKSKLMLSSYYSPEIKPKHWGNNTSGLKAKKVNMIELCHIAKKSLSKRGKWIKVAMRWMLANMLVGLRPCEWRYAHLDDSSGKFILVVQNAKISADRSNGALRHLDISGLRSIELKWIKLHLNGIKKYTVSNATWNSLYEGVRQTIRRLMRRLMVTQRKYPSLYSTRHQFAANAKSAGYSKVEVAALMGHAVDTTAGEHYGKKKHGSGGCKVKPDRVEVNSVRIQSKKNSKKLVE